MAIVPEELSFLQLVDAVRQLSTTRQDELHEIIWGASVDIPMEHQKIVNERISEYKANPGILLDWNLASKNLKG